MKNQAWINGKFVDTDNAKISIFDRGFMYGDGIFETMRSYARVVFKIDEHLDRLFRGLKTIGIKSPYTKPYLKEIIYEVLKMNGLKSAYVRLSVTRGEGRFGLEFKDIFNPNVVLVVKEFGEYHERMYQCGISAKIVPIRQNERSPLSGIKSLNFLNNILARLEAKDSGYDDAILMNTEGYVAESVTANIFLVSGNRLITPSLNSGILCGITRDIVIKIAKNLRLAVREKSVTRRELFNADEVFLTNSLIEVLPVTKVGPKRIGDGRVGNLTKLLRISYQKEVIKETLLNRLVSP